MQFCVWGEGHRGNFHLHWNELLPFLENLEMPGMGDKRHLPAISRLSVPLVMAWVTTATPQHHLCHGVLDHPETPPSLETAARESCKGTLE